ncbi:hypothetical protein WG66_015302 [Moniliophthora roreri]|nr:hypothetical protein WG66_015302 [Moniliophthora roreri]
MLTRRRATPSKADGFDALSLQRTAESAIVQIVNFKVAAKPLPHSGKRFLIHKATMRHPVFRLLENHSVYFVARSHYSGQFWYTECDYADGVRAVMKLSSRLDK